MIVPQTLVNSYLEKWESVPRAELRARLLTIKKKPNTRQIVAETKAIKFLLS